LLDQGILDDDTNEIDLLGQQVAGALRTMQNVSELYAQTCRGIREQQAVLRQIDTCTSEAMDDIRRPREDFERARRPQRMSPKYIWGVALIALLVAVGIGLIIAWRVAWSNK
jgi:t-SNARE complex subunit (syntaxin)